MKNVIRIATVLTFLVLSGCQKDDMLTTNSSDNSNTKELRKVGSVYNMLTIEHEAARTSQPAYKVEVASSGDVLFTGISNTALVGQKHFKISTDAVDAIRYLVIRSNFYEMPVLPYVADLPMVTTTFQESEHSGRVIRIDYATQQYNMQYLINLRLRIESLLEIETLVKKPNSLDRPMLEVFHE